MNDPDPLRIPPRLAPDDETPHGGVFVEVWPEEPPPPRWRIGRTLLWFFLTLVLLGLVPPATVLALRWLPPPTTAFMLQSPVKPVQYRWVPAAQIPDSLRKAVVAAEDQKFWVHWGFDFIAIAEALEHNEKSRRKRGASTITQQVAKNLFLWPSRSYTRKGLEVTFTLLLELLWPKERILEVYLNVAEFGPGIYGAEAASRKFFGKGASAMTAEETARLAAVLPNPRNWRADRPGPYVQARTDWILNYLGYRPRFSAFPPDTEEPPEPAEPGAAPAPAPDAASDEMPAFEPAEFDDEEQPPAAEDDPAETPAPADDMPEDPPQDAPATGPDTEAEPGPTS